MIVIILSALLLASQTSASTAGTRDTYFLSLQASSNPIAGSGSKDLELRIGLFGICIRDHIRLFSCTTSSTVPLMAVQTMANALTNFLFTLAKDLQGQLLSGILVLSFSLFTLCSLTYLIAILPFELVSLFCCGRCFNNNNLTNPLIYFSERVGWLAVVLGFAGVVGVECTLSAAEALAGGVGGGGSSVERAGTRVAIQRGGTAMAVLWAAWILMLAWMAWVRGVVWWKGRNLERGYGQGERHGSGRGREDGIEM
ncbi:hypothetical protein K402DRAFT_397871 [Aulographum hederae CBS 113979]|uniref:MARVEL domain-containing protein n=1 Tax=Aulographum hederae CBS 113979 TaxID=1176131 RepID=A0A6G1GMT8_9PEZI|nr:hypothetical protein K402DRAFT_397871 [Aulographum hederae CBS 113979]